MRIQLLGLLTATLFASACAMDDASSQRLGNSPDGKDDSATVRLKLTNSSSVASFLVGCDQPSGCEGHITVKLRSPDACALFPDDARCGVARSTTPYAREILTATVKTSTEGERRLPLIVQSGDGLVFTSEIAAAFSAKADEELDVTIEKTAGTPDMTIEVKAAWKAAVDPGAAANEVLAYLTSIPGVTVTEIATAHAGYHAYQLEYDQFVDHDNPAAGTFKQKMVLHHKDKAAPMVLFTTGYDLYEPDWLSELGTSMAANQISVEQRYFGTSKPASLTAEAWSKVTIAQAAKDHHRIVEILKPFYGAKWVSTGHSKGGMTSIFHRRFFPQDVDATVAYVAPISYADPDPRYVPFLDTIGEQACRDAIRGVQKTALQMADLLLPMAQAEYAMYTFERTGGLASSMEKSILALEWSFWQYNKVENCAPFLTAPTDAAGIYNLVATYAGGAMPDVYWDNSVYDYQAATQLGHQSFSTTHLTGLLKYEAIKINGAPAGTMPVHDGGAAMRDIQEWVTNNADHMLFIYGQFDPWTGGAYDVPTMRPDVYKVVVPKAPHAAMIEELPAAARDATLNTIEAWVGVRPAFTTPTVPRVPMPRMH